MANEGADPAAGRKRKQPIDRTDTFGLPHNAKRVRMNKMKDARAILTQTSEKALNSNGELDVSSFIRAREVEIKAMEASMGESKNALSSRAFQQVPNELRRRTASHNVRKVPAKLRSRAAREMKEDNTPTVTARRRKPTAQMRLRLETAKKLQELHARQKSRRLKARDKQPGTENGLKKQADAVPSVRRLKRNAMSKPEDPASKFRKRQKHKCWLPTHVYHAKRAHMTEPKHPLWRFALALTPTERAFRKTHRAGSLRGCVAWDMSYISTILLEGLETGLTGLLRGIGVDEEALSGKRMAKWRRGMRSWQGWVQERDREEKWIAKVDIIWCTQEDLPSTQDSVPKKISRRRLLLRVHPSAFLQLWTELLKVAQIQRPPVMVEDLRFEIGAIEVTGPGSTETLVAALKPTTNCDGDIMRDRSAETWMSLGSISNPSCLPSNAVIAFNASDPRLRYPPRKVEQPATHCAEDALLQLIASWPPDTSCASPSIFDRNARLKASRLLSSQKAINRRKGDAAPGHHPSASPDDPRIPILLVATRSSAAGAQGSWTVLLPWKCVLPVWYYIMYFPLSAGGNPRFGGLDEGRQISFEQGSPWFPGDFPGTQAGWEWELMERAKRKADWEKRPKGKRAAWESLDLGAGKKGEIGLGWACDWVYLFDPASATVPASTSQATTTDSSTKNNSPSKPLEADHEATDSTPATLPSFIHHLPAPYAANLLASPKTVPRDSQHLVTIHVTLLSRGNPTACARIYRLPTASHLLRTQWLALAKSILHPAKKQPRRSKPNLERKQILASLPRNESHPVRTQQTASSLLSPYPLSWADEAAEDEIIQPGNPKYPVIPNRSDLIGFVTTGNFDLGQGKASAIGCVAVAKVANQQQLYSFAVAENGTADEAERAVERVALQRMEDLEKELGQKVVRRLCIVRDAGQSVGRLGTWELI